MSIISSQCAAVFLRRGASSIIGIRPAITAVHFFSSSASIFTEAASSAADSSKLPSPTPSPVLPIIPIPSHNSHKVCTPSDAVSLISAGDTICVSGFVGQGSPDLILKALSDRYEQECQNGVKGGVVDLTVLFGGGPGDWQSRGLNYLARIQCTDQIGADPRNPLIKRAIGGHFGQVPMLGDLATSNRIEAWTLPMGSISRMIRAQGTHSPGHITTVGLGTYVDPTPGVGTGGAANQLALDSPLNQELVTKLSIMGSDYLMYKALPIQVAIIRATTADSSGNLSFEHESLLCDQKNIAMAARNSGGVVLAQVKRLCAVGSLPSRSVGVPGAMVDCVCVVDEEDHDVFHRMSYTKRHDPVLCGEIKSPSDEVPKMPLDERKVIARRASFALKPGKVVNLGIGLPEGVASVAGEEGQLPFITLTTEPGVFGGLPASCQEFGPAVNADALVEMNQMFDYYDGGGLDMCFLGAAQISPQGDVNVSRMSQKKLIGPGGFINISQCTRNISFLCTFTAKGLSVDIDGDKGNLSIATEGKVKKFVNKVFETTFAGDEAVRRGQRVYYVTERAVFRRTANHRTIELMEIAPGIDLQRDILDQMEFDPIISPELKVMDRRIFRHEKMNMQLFGSLRDRVTYHSDEHVVFIDLFGISLASKEEIDSIRENLDSLLKPITKERGPVDAIISYENFDVRTGTFRYMFMLVLVHTLLTVIRL
jgi:propionate CoA-transferase